MAIITQTQDNLHSTTLTTVEVELSGGLIPVPVPNFDNRTTAFDDNVTLTDTNPLNIESGLVSLIDGGQLTPGLTVSTGAGNDTINITNGTDSGEHVSNISADTGNDLVTVNYDGVVVAGNDVISGGEGQDTINVLGNETLKTSVAQIRGDFGDDTINVSNVKGEEPSLLDFNSSVMIRGDGAIGGIVPDEIPAIVGDDVITVTDSENVTVLGESGQDTITVVDSTGYVQAGWDADEIYASVDSGELIIDGSGTPIIGDIPFIGGIDSEGIDEPDNFFIDPSSTGSIVLDDFSNGFDLRFDDVLNTWDGSDPATGATVDLADLLDDGVVEGFTTGGTNEGADLLDGGTLRSATFNLVGGGTLHIDNVEIACFVTGTSIATPAGDVAVETLAIGDLVTTADGNTAAVKWMGRREISSVFAAKNTSVHPILITEGALGNGLPTADLRVSPDHAMYVDGVLVHAEALVNGSTIVQEAIEETFTYYHIELENHDLVLANGAAAETFVDSDVRARFDNAAEYVELYGTTESASPMALPRVKSKRQLPAALKAKLA